LPTSLGINYCLTSSGNSLMCVWSIEVIFHSLSKAASAVAQISRSRPPRATELIYFFRIVNLYLHILITHRPERDVHRCIGPGGIYILWRYCWEAREMRNNYSFLHSCSLSNSLEKNCITISAICTLTLGLRKKCTSLFHAAKIMENR
jgi:hypothetical protein